MTQSVGSYDLLLVGTGFASSFFLHRALEKRPELRVLVLERGRVDSHSWRIENRDRMAPGETGSSTPALPTYVNRTPEKPWVFTLGLGGGSSCWWACTPRLMPSDFRTESRYGVGRDWPLGYDDLEPHYCEAEAIMGIAGSQGSTPYPMSVPYPQPAHRLTSVDRHLSRQFPELFFPMPTARASRATANRRACCATGVCGLCPVDAKFTVQNELAHLYADPRVTVLYGAQVLAVDIEAGRARGVLYEHGGEEKRARAGLVALGANALFNAHILLRSGLAHPLLGRGICEQRSISCSVDLDGLDNYDGGTSLTGHGYMLYDGEHRRDHAACLIETSNIPDLRLEPGRYRQRLSLKLIFEDLDQPQNRVTLGDDPRKPEIQYFGPSEYLDRGVERARERLPELLGSLPAERIETDEALIPTDAHILGGAIMGEDPAAAVVDRLQQVHGVSDLLSLGGSSFPSISPANPTLTISALSLWSADRVL